MGSYQLITILGPTASGKTPFAAALSACLDTEIISADSRQVYRTMDLGTGKDLADYVVNGKPIPYHLIDICDPGYKYNVFEYQHDFFRVYKEIKAKGKLPILCGGTGMYIEDNQRSGCRFITVDANANAFHFYEKNGFSFITDKDKSNKNRAMYFDLKATQ